MAQHLSFWADTIEKLRRTKIASETWNIFLSTNHLATLFAKAGLRGKKFWRSDESWRTTEFFNSIGSDMPFAAVANNIHAEPDDE